MFGKDTWVLGVAFDGFDAAVKEIVRMVECVLVERIGAADEADDARVGPPAGTAGLLEEFHPCSRIAVDEDSVEVPDVDPNLEGIRTPDDADVAGVQPGFKFFSPLVRECGLIRGHVVGEAGITVTLEAASGDLSVLFGRLSASREDDSLETAFDERRCETCSCPVCRSSLPLLAAGWLPEEPVR